MSVRQNYRWDRSHIQLSLSLSVSRISLTLSLSLPFRTTGSCQSRPRYSETHADDGAGALLPDPSWKKREKRAWNLLNLTLRMEERSVQEKTALAVWTYSQINKLINKGCMKKGNLNVDDGPNIQDQSKVEIQLISFTFYTPLSCQIIMSSIIIAPK